MTQNVFEKIICKCALKAKPIKKYMIYIFLLFSIGLIFFCTCLLTLTPKHMNNAFLDILYGSNESIVVALILSIGLTIWCVSDIMRPGYINLGRHMKKIPDIYIWLFVALTFLFVTFLTFLIVGIIYGSAIWIGVAAIEFYTLGVTQRCPKINPTP